MGYKTLRGTKGINMSSPITEVPVEKEVRLTVFYTDDTRKGSLKIGFENDFAERLYDYYTIDGPRFRFLMAALCTTDEMKSIIDESAYERLNGKKLVADIIKKIGHDIVLNKREDIWMLLNESGELVQTFASYKDSYDYCKENEIQLSRNILTNHVLENTSKSKLPKDRRF